MKASSSLGACRLLISAVITAMGVSPGLAAPSPAIVDFDLLDPVVLATSDATVGWSFSVNSVVEVSSLGFFDSGLDGLREPHLVGIWDENQQLLASAEVRAGEHDPLVGKYRCGLIEPIVLSPGELYVIGATVPLGLFYGWGEPLEWDAYPLGNIEPDSLSVDSNINLVCTSLRFPGEAGARGTPGPGVLNFPTQVDPYGYFFAANFTFTAVPEPSAAAVVCCAVFVVLRRPRSRA
ncbi:MAG: hypothetical protein AMK72_08365 [Planctomycetes bacterium SM23_25]|nr:MAG: hypothetical protein AMK72_08365 [Planctomycetes bacterium SM23_25]